MNNSFKGFQLYDKDERRSINAVSITRSGQIGFPANMYNEHNLILFEAAFLYWNDGTQEIGIEFLSSEQKNSFKLARTKKGAYVSAKSFLKHYDLDLDIYAHRYGYEVRWLTDMGIARPGKLFVVRLTADNVIDPGGSS